MNHLDDKVIPLTILQRKGARKAELIPEEVMLYLQKGQLATVNLTEWLAVDHKLLLKHVLTQLELNQHQQIISDQLIQLKETKIMKVIPAIAQGWLAFMYTMMEADRLSLFNMLSSHLSDSVRCWAAYIVGMNTELTIDQKLASIRPFAADSHFGVREIAWMAVRESLALELERAIVIFKDWVMDENEWIRRFAIESIRPNGVWAKHIPALKQNPSMALPLLEIVKADPAKYVQDSTANWLNDASKTNPEWVKRVCEQWRENSDNKATNRIIIRALRSIK